MDRSESTDGWAWNDFPEDLVVTIDWLPCL